MRRAVLGVAVLVAIAFAIEGGEYGTFDILSQQSKRRRLQTDIDSLRAEIDSLARVKKAILTDAATQERIAREEFGMVRGNEILYRFAEPEDSVKKP